MHRPFEAQLPEIRTQWQEQGYALIRGGAPEEACRSLARAIVAHYRQHVGDGQGFAGGGELSGHLNCYPGAGSKSLVTLLEAAGLSELIRELFGAALTLSSVGCNCNCPGSYFQNFHMDSNWANRFIIVNIALVDTDLVNGATEMVPGSERKPLRYWEFVLQGLWRRGVRPQLKTGDIVIRPSTLWHRGTPNRGRDMRPMIGLVYEPANDVQKPFDYQQYGGGVVLLANRFGSNLKGRVTEWICVRQPWLHALVRIGKSALAPVGRST